MKLVLERLQLSPTFTIGQLTADGVWECWALEDQVRPEGEAKVPGKTAIPYGAYKVVRNLSRRFKRLMLQILDVPNFEGIRIHGGNTAEDTEGCILVGLNRYPDHISRCAPALSALEAKVFAALDANEDVTLDVTKPQPGDVLA